MTKPLKIHPQQQKTNTKQNCTIDNINKPYVNDAPKSSTTNKLYSFNFPHNTTISGRINACNITVSSVCSLVYKIDVLPTVCSHIIGETDGHCHTIS